MRTFIFFAPIFLAAFLAQTLWPGSWAAWGLSPHWLLIVTAYLGLTRGPVWGEISGFVSGLLLDAFSVELFGASAIVFAIAGFVTGLMQRQWDKNQPQAQILLIFLLALGHRLGMSFLGSLFLDTPRAVGLVSWLARPLVSALFAPVVFRLLDFWSEFCFPGYSYVE